MTMGFYVPPEQFVKDKTDYARRGISKGRPLIVLEYSGGIVFVADNPSRQIHKVAELYDRIALGGIGRLSEFENLRTAGITLADIRGYQYGREDVTSRSIANAYSRTLGQIFIQEAKPYEVELCVAEVGVAGAPNALYHVSFDGTVVDHKGYLAMGAQADELNQALERGYQDAADLRASVRLALETLRRVAPEEGDGNSSRLEIALLERDRPRRSFRRPGEDEVAELTRDDEPS